MHQDKAIELARFAALDCGERHAYILRHRSGPLAGQRFPLRELPAGKAHRGEPLPSCGLFCESAEQEYSA